MDEEKEDGGAAMDAILAAYGEKMWGNYLEMSSLIVRESQLMEEMIDKMAKTIVDAALLNGYTPLSGSQAVMKGHGWMRDEAMLGGKLRAAMSARPTQFVAFCGFMMHEAMDKKRAAEQSERMERERLRRVLDLIASAESLEGLRSGWDAMKEREEWD